MTKPVQSNFCHGAVSTSPKPSIISGIFPFLLRPAASGCHLVCNWPTDFLYEQPLKCPLWYPDFELLQVNAGVSHGAILSPTFFFLYVNDLFDLDKINCTKNTLTSMRDIMYISAYTEKTRRILSFHFRTFWYLYFILIFISFWYLNYFGIYT